MNLERAAADRTLRRSRRWIHKLVCYRSNDFLGMMRAGTTADIQATAIDWRSPLESDTREYRDGKALELLGIGHLRDELKEFWPARGPVWDALGVGVGTRECFLVEAKAHIPEALSPPTRATGQSLQRIRARLSAAKRSLGSTAPVDWSGAFYQYANRLAFLHWLRSRQVPAFLVSVYFTNAPDVPHPVSQSEWEGALTLIRTYLGLGRHRLKPYAIDVFVDAESLRNLGAV